MPNQQIAGLAPGSLPCPPQASQFRKSVLKDEFVFSMNESKTNLHQSTAAVCCSAPAAALSLFGATTEAGRFTIVIFTVMTVAKPYLYDRDVIES